MDTHGGRLGYKFIPTHSSAVCGVRCLQDGMCSAVAVTMIGGQYMCILYKEGMAERMEHAGSMLMMKMCEEGMEIKYIH